jgi:hypothetical protein
VEHGRNAASDKAFTQDRTTESPTVIREDPTYKAILAAGVSDQDVQNGSVIVGHVFCCGG